MMKGILFYGPPGVGKTYLSRALGSKLGMNVISLKGSDILSKYHGDSPVKLRSYFDKSRELAPCMIVIDEIDAIASNREDIANIVNQAILEAIWEGSDSISTEHIEK